MLSDEQLLEQFRAGDQAAFEALVVRYKREVYGLCYRFAENHEDAHDLSQDAFLRVFRAAGSFRGDSSFKTWLYRIVMNLGLNHVQRRRVPQRRQLALEDAPEPSHRPDPVAALGLGERQRELSGAIRRLPPKQRQTLILKVYEELRFKDIAGVMSCSVGTAKANYFHAVARLKRELGVEEAQHEQL